MRQTDWFARVSKAMFVLVSAHAQTRQSHHLPLARIKAIE
jgi:hypothetical protein